MKRIAFDRIAENARTKDPFLDLGCCGLTEIPSQVLCHTWLEELSLAERWWDIEQISGTATLCESLNPGEPNVIGELPADLHRLANLKKLWINISEHSARALKDLESLGGLGQLEVLGLAGLPIKSIESLGGLKNLHMLDLAHCSLVRDFAPLSGMSSLRFLDLQGTRIRSLEPLQSLVQLKFINLCQSATTNLTPLLSFLDRGVDFYDDRPPHRDMNGIYVADCPLKTPPPEIVYGGAEAIRTYFYETVAQGVDHLYEAKMLILGEGGAGKTSLLRRLFKPTAPLPEESETTKGIAIHRHEFRLENGRKYRLNVWDFGGQEIYHATHQFFLTRRSLYVLVDDTRRDSKTVHDQGFKYWLEAVDALSHKSPLLIFQNEKGGRSKAIDEAGIKAAFPNVKDVYRGDLALQHSVDHLRQAIQLHAQQLPHVGEELPAKWLLIRADIEGAAKKRPFISQQEYFSIYNSYLEPDRRKAGVLSKYLHDLGVFLHFQEDKLLRRTVILQNQWATEAVFLLVDDNAIKAAYGRFTEVDCSRIWSSADYKDMHPELLALMQKFELCYKLHDASPDMWLIPQLLPPSRPIELGEWSEPGDLTLRYVYEFMPKGILNRLMVRKSKYILRPDLAWSIGALFELEDTQLLAQIPARGGEIILRSRGPARRDLLAIISADLDALNDTYHGVSDKVKKLVPCNCDICRNAQVPEYFDLRRLLQRRRDAKRTIECGTSYKDVSVQDLLEGAFFSPDATAAARAKPVRESTSGNTEIRVFIASSMKMQQERDHVELLLRRIDGSPVIQGQRISIVRAESLDHAFGANGSQSKIDVELANCDVLLCLIGESVGDATSKEVQFAISQFSNIGRPKVYVYFNETTIRAAAIGTGALQSIESLGRFLIERGQYLQGYKDLNNLETLIRNQVQYWGD